LERKALSTREDIQTLVDSFYAKVRVDELIGPIFNDVAKVDWSEHLPKLYDFWNDLLLGSDLYHGRPFPPHTKLNLEIQHFERWLRLFTATVDEHFTGLKALEAKQRALRIGQNFATNLQLIDRA
jgi:hemoglobin